MVRWLLVRFRAVVVDRRAVGKCWAGPLRQEKSAVDEGIAKRRSEVSPALGEAEPPPHGERGLFLTVRSDFICRQRQRRVHGLMLGQFRLDVLV